MPLQKQQAGLCGWPIQKRPQAEHCSRLKSVKLPALNPTGTLGIEQQLLALQVANKLLSLSTMPVSESTYRMLHKGNPAWGIFSNAGRTQAHREGRPRDNTERTSQEDNPEETSLAGLCISGFPSLGLENEISALSHPTCSPTTSAEQAQSIPLSGGHRAGDFALCTKHMEERKATEEGAQESLI